MTGLPVYVKRPEGMTAAQRLVLTTLEHAGSRGYTSHELGAHCDSPLNSVTARVLELRRMGLVVPVLVPRVSGKGLRAVKRATVNGGLAQVWRRAVVGESRAAVGAAEQRAAAAELRRATAALTVAACEAVDAELAYDAGGTHEEWNRRLAAAHNARRRLREVRERYRAAVGREAAAARRVTAPALELAEGAAS